MIYEPFSVVKVPFPFTDLPIRKRRPAIVLSPKAFQVAHRHAVLVMITTAKGSVWPTDVAIKNLQSTGLTAASVVRMKMFTLDARLIIAQLGQLSLIDRQHVKKSLAQSLIKFS